MPRTSIPARLVYLNAASATAVARVDRHRLVAELEPDAWELTVKGDKLFPLFFGSGGPPFIPSEAALSPEDQKKLEAAMGLLDVLAAN